VHNIFVKFETLLNTGIAKYWHPLGWLSQLFTAERHTACLLCLHVHWGCR